MSKILQDSTFFCLAISLIGYEIGIILRQKTKLALCNPLHDLHCICYYYFESYQY